MDRTFVFYERWWTGTEGLPPDQRYRMVGIIVEYAFEGKEPPADTDPALLMAFRMGVKSSLDSDVAKHKRMCEMRSEMGKRGGAPIGNQNARKKEEEEEGEETTKKQSKNKAKTKQKTSKKQAKTSKTSFNDNDNVDSEGKKERGRDSEGKKERGREKEIIQERVERKEKETAKENAADAEEYTPPEYQELMDWNDGRGLAIDMDKFYRHYNGRGWKINGEYIRDWKAVAKRWILRQKEIDIQEAGGRANWEMLHDEYEYDPDLTEEGHARDLARRKAEEEARRNTPPEELERRRKEMRAILDEIHGIGRKDEKEWWEREK